MKFLVDAEKTLYKNIESNTYKIQTLEYSLILLYTQGLSLFVDRNHFQFCYK